MFPERFTGLACLDLLRVEMRLAAIRCGYNIVVRHSTYIKIPGSQRLYELRFGCQRGALYTNKSTTAQPSETTCQQLNATSFELGASTTVATMETAVPSSNQPTKVITYKTNNKPTQRNTVVSKGELNYVNRTRPAKYKTTTKLPLTKEEACPFKISLFLQSDTALPTIRRRDSLLVPRAAPQFHSQYHLIVTLMKCSNSHCLQETSDCC
jgi:hypothetical protein